MARTTYIRCIYGIFGREITKYTVLCGVYIRIVIIPESARLMCESAHTLLLYFRTTKNTRVGLARTTYIRCIYGIFGRDFINGVELARTIYIRCIYGIFGRSFINGVELARTIYIRCIYGIFGRDFINGVELARNIYIRYFWQKFHQRWRIGQNHIYTVYIRYFWQGNCQIYGHMRCIYTVLANPTHVFLMFRKYGNNVCALSHMIPALSGIKSTTHLFVSGF